MDWKLTYIFPILGAKSIRIYLSINAFTNHCFLKFKIFVLNSVSGFQFSSVFVQIGWHGEWKGRGSAKLVSRNVQVIFSSVITVINFILLENKFTLLHIRI
jgi:hypothetical protein